jgi:hypothetical protein
MIRCDECKKNIIKETKYQDWLKLFYFVSFLFNENYIEQTTRDEMVDALMAFKRFCFPPEDER